MISCCYLWTFPGQPSRASQAVFIPPAERVMPPGWCSAEANPSQPVSWRQTALQRDPAVLHTMPQLERRGHPCLCSWGAALFFSCSSAQNLSQPSATAGRGRLSDHPLQLLAGGIILFDPRLILPFASWEQKATGDVSSSPLPSQTE